MSFPGVPTSMTLNDPEHQKIGFLVNFFAILGCGAHLEWVFAEVTGDRPRQLAYEIKLMLSRVSWALAQISCSISFVNLVGLCVIFSKCSISLALSNRGLIIYPLCNVMKLASLRFQNCLLLYWFQKMVLRMYYWCFYVFICYISMNASNIAAAVFCCTWMDDRVQSR